MGNELPQIAIARTRRMRGSQKLLSRMDTVRNFAGPAISASQFKAPSAVGNRTTTVRPGHAGDAGKDGQETRGTQHDGQKEKVGHEE